MNYPESFRHFSRHEHDFLMLNSKDNNILISIICVIIGFGLAVLWDLWKRRMDRSEEIKRAGRAVLQEMKVNLRVFKLNNELLKMDDEAADSAKEIVNQLDRFSCAAGESVYLRGSLEHADSELSEKLRNIYAGLTSLNYKIEGRELYRATNGAMSNYHTRRKIINSELSVLLSSLERQMEDIQPRIERLV